MGYLLIDVSRSLIGLFGGACLIINRRIDRPQGRTGMLTHQAFSVFALCPAAFILHPELRIKQFQRLVCLGIICCAVFTYHGCDACCHHVSPIALGQGCRRKAFCIHRFQILTERGPQALHSAAICIIAKLPKHIFYRLLLDLVFHYRQGTTHRIDISIRGIDIERSAQLLHIVFQLVEEHLSLTNWQEREGQTITTQIEFLGKLGRHLLMGQC